MSARIGAVEDVKRVERWRFADYPTGVNRLSSGIPHQPVFVIFVNRRPLRYFKRSRPDSRRQAQRPYFAFESAHSVAEQSAIGSGVLPASILIALINVKEVISEVSHVLREPHRVCRSRALIEAEVIGSPTLPAHRAGSAYAGVVQVANDAPIRLQLLVIVGAGANQ